MTAILAALAVSLMVLVALAVGAIALRSSEQARQLELARRLGPELTEEGPELFSPMRDEDQLASQLGDTGTRLTTFLRWSGEDLTVSQFLLVSGALGVLLPALLASVTTPWYAPLGLLGALLPTWWLSLRARQRSARISEQLPEALDLIARTLRAGHGFAEALRMVGDEVKEPLGSELLQTSEENRLGLDLRACLEGLNDRVPGNEELRFLVSTVLLHRETGGNLIEVMENLADTIRNRIVFERKVKALTAEVRMSATILQLLPVFAATALLLFEPDYLMPLVTTLPGRVMLGTAVVFMATGALVMRRIAAVRF